jgi:hypothetical protein
MVDGGTSVMMVMKISKSPSRQGAERSFWFRIVVSDGVGVAELYVGKMPNPR